LATRSSATAEKPREACYVSQGMGLRTVSNSKSDLQGHSRTLAMVPFNRSHTISY